MRVLKVATRFHATLLHVYIYAKKSNYLQFTQRGAA